MEVAKGPQVLLEAVAALVHRGVDVRCTFVGDGPLAEALRGRVSELGLDDHVRFVGRIANAELPLVYRSADVTVVPSILTDDFAEPWSLAVNEAMGCGSLVVASTAVGAVRDGLVTDGRTGLTFPWGDVAALADTLEASLTDPVAAAEIAEAGRRAVQDYSYERAAAAFGQAAEVARGRAHPVAA
jgi:glycosyltransferase involved in cell wall biosynthesis